MLTIGLTGGIGSGKTTVSNLFSELNNNAADVVLIIDTDIIARQIVKIGEPAYFRIIDVFGKGILKKNKSIARKALRKLIFNDSESKKLLEEITHPQIKAEVEIQISGCHAQYCIVVIPLLFETKSNYPLDRILVVDCEIDIQIQRTAQRDKITTQEVKQIIQLQSSSHYKIEHADDIIRNSDDYSHLKSQVINLHALYLKLSQANKK